MMKIQMVSSSSEVIKNEASIYAIHRKQGRKQMTPLQQLRKYGYWDMTDGFFPGCYVYFKNNQVHFYGVIAAKK